MPYCLFLRGNMNRSSGILLPIFSLPSPYGIGTFGKSAFDFIDFLVDARQSYWQILPVGPTSLGNSPYTSYSTFAGNPLFIDLDLLVKGKLLKKSEILSFDWQSKDNQVDYDLLNKNRLALLQMAFDRCDDGVLAKVSDFSNANVWVENYALYMALKDYFDGASWMDWEDEDIRLHRPSAVNEYLNKLKKEVDFYKFIQYLFYEQWTALKKYANDNGVKIIGDIPIYVALDSCDVWSEPENFFLDEMNVPKKVAGVPPDYFSEEGQLWGNPLYDWDYMKNDGYGWWIRRIDGASKLYDVIRIDHFRAFESYWAVDKNEKTAKNGEWIKGSGIDLVRTLTNWFYNIEFIAEDLGILTPEVNRLIEESGLPGMKVLEFAFDWQTPSSYLPHNYERNCICYAGTHDNNTILGWKKSADKKDIAFAKEYLAINSDSEFSSAIIKCGMRSVAKLFVAQLQDYLLLGEEARINTPGTVGNNWKWKLDSAKELNKSLSSKIAKVTRMYGRG